MLANYAYLIIALASSVLASPLVERDTCWSGNIHSACNGATAGCTEDGILVTCQEGAQMIYSSMCKGANEDDLGTCHYDAACNATC